MDRLLFEAIVVGCVLLMVSAGCIVFLWSNILGNRLPFDEFSARMALWGSVCAIIGAPLFFIGFDLKPSPSNTFIVLAVVLGFMAMTFVIALVLWQMNRKNNGGTRSGPPQIGEAGGDFRSAESDDDPSLFIEPFVEPEDPSVSGLLPKLRGRKKARDKK